MGAQDSSESIVPSQRCPNQRPLHPRNVLNGAYCSAVTVLNLQADLLVGTRRQLRLSASIPAGCAAGCLGRHDCPERPCTQIDLQIQCRHSRTVDAVDTEKGRISSNPRSGTWAGAWRFLHQQKVGITPWTRNMEGKCPQLKQIGGRVQAVRK